MWRQLLKHIFRNLNEFRKFITEAHTNTAETKWIFRGQSKDYPLIPTLWRNADLENLTDKNIENLEQKHNDSLEEFRKAINASKYKLPYDKPVLQLGQHYGLSTTLLDWTIDPAIALFFPLVNHNEDLWVYALEVTKGEVDAKIENNINYSIFDPLNLLEWNKINYFINMPELLRINTNIKTQRGLFTYSPKINYKIGDELPPKRLNTYNIKMEDKDEVLETISNEYPEIRYTAFYLTSISKKVNSNLEKKWKLTQRSMLI
jgi:hypothetical protein